MVRKIFTLDGHIMETKDGFYDEVERVLCPEIDYFGRNWDAFNDILRGGFGSFDYGEDITIEFKHKKWVEKHLGSVFFEMFEDIMKDHDHVHLVYLED